ncbi:MAG: phage tail spike protein [Acutalibacteraceae bacterium]|nr:phage tail spike protein [Acutalibacteraceae bacterium]
MLPLLYEPTSQDLSANSLKFIGRITKCEKCIVSEQLNGEYQLSATFAPTDGFVDQIQNQNYLQAKANPFDDPQFFEIYQTSIDGEGRVSVTARHIKHSAYNNLCLTDLYDKPVAKTPQQHWDYLKNEGRITLTNFTFNSSITNALKIVSGYESSNTVGGLFEEFASVFGGEYHYDNFTVNFLQNRGSKKNYVLRWNKNIASPSLTLDTASIYSHYVASGKITAINTVFNTRQGVTLFTEPFLIANSTSKVKRIYNWDATSQMEIKEVEVPQNNYSAPRTELRTLAANFDAESILQIHDSANLKVNFRPALDEMSAVGMGDTVDVELKGGRTVEAKIIATSFNCLSERWESIELGHEKLKLADYIAR